MASVVQFKFRSETQYTPVRFDGAFISVGELKRLIAQKKNLGQDALDELRLSDPRTNTEYTDDAAQVARNSIVLVRRQPRTQLRTLTGTTTAGQPPAVPALGAQAGQQQVEPAEATVAADEFGSDPFSQAALAFQQEQEQLAKAAAQQATAEASFRGLGMAGSSGYAGGREFPGAGRGRGRGRGRGPPPPHYFCPRCNQGGHWENDCPTQGDSNYDVRPVRRPAGIPTNKLQRNTDGSLLLASGETGELMVNAQGFAQAVAMMSGAPAVSETASFAASLPPEANHTVPAQPPQQLPPPEVTAPAQESIHRSQPLQTTAETGAEAPSESLQAPEQDVPDATAIVKQEPAQVQAVGVMVKPSSPTPSATDVLFDDDQDLAAPVAPVKLNLGMGFVEKSAQASKSQRSASPAPSAKNKSVDNAPSSKSDQEFIALLPHMLDILPRLDIRLLVALFGNAVKPDGMPATYPEYEKIQAEVRSKAQTSSAPQPQHPRRQRSRERSEATRVTKSPRDEMDCRRSRHRSRSRSPVARWQPKTAPQTAKDKSSVKIERQESSRQQEEASPERRPRSRLPEENSFVHDASGHDMPDGYRRKRGREASVEVAMERAPDRGHTHRHGSKAWSDGYGDEDASPHSASAAQPPSPSAGAGEEADNGLVDEESDYEERQRSSKDKGGEKKHKKKHKKKKLKEKEKDREKKRHRSPEDHSPDDYTDTGLTEQDVRRPTMHHRQASRPHSSKYEDDAGDGYEDEEYIPVKPRRYHIAEDVEYHEDQKRAAEPRGRRRSRDADYEDQPRRSRVSRDVSYEEPMGRATSKPNGYGDGVRGAVDRGGKRLVYLPDGLGGKGETRGNGSSKLVAQALNRALGGTAGGVGTAHRSQSRSLQPQPTATERRGTADGADRWGHDGFAELYDEGGKKATSRWK